MYEYEAVSVLTMEEFQLLLIISMQEVRWWTIKNISVHAKKFRLYTY